MLKILSKLLGRDLTARSEPVPEDERRLSDEQIMEEYFPPSKHSKQAKQALRHVVTLLTEQLGREESQRLTSLVTSHLQPGETASGALEDALLGDDGQRRGKWLMIQVDWKATDEVEWQANELLASAGVAETWHLQDELNTTVPLALSSFADWVKLRGYCLLHVDLGHDAYYAFLVLQEKSDEIIRAAETAGLEIQTSDEFAAENMRN